MEDCLACNNMQRQFYVYKVFKYELMLMVDYLLKAVCVMYNTPFANGGLWVPVLHTMPAVD